MKNFFYKIVELKDGFKDIFIKLFWYRKFSVFFIYGGIVFNSISWIILWQLTKLNQEIIILHYNAYLGIDVMLNTGSGLYPDLFMISLGGLIVLILDVILAGVLLYLSSSINKSIPGDCEEKAESLDVNLLGSNLILVGGFLVQVSIFVYSIVILFVN